MSKQYRNKDWEADPYTDYSCVEIPEMILARNEVRFLGQLIFHDQNEQEKRSLGQSIMELSMHPSINEAQLTALRSSIGDALASGYWGLSHQLTGEIQYTLTPPIIEAELVLQQDLTNLATIAQDTITYDTLLIEQMAGHAA